MENVHNILVQKKKCPSMSVQYGKRVHNDSSQYGSVYNIIISSIWKCPQYISSKNCPQCQFKRKWSTRHSSIRESVLQYNMSSIWEKGPQYISQYGKSVHINYFDMEKGPQFISQYGKVSTIN